MTWGLPLRAGALAALVAMATGVASHGAQATPRRRRDHSQIVFASNLSPAARVLDGRVGASRLHAFSADRRARVDFSTGIGNLSDGPASVSPDGRMVAFIRAGGSVDVAGELWVANEDGSGARRLLTPESAESFSFEGFPGLGFQAPAWSPDGTRLAIDAVSTASCLPGYTKCASWYTVLVDLSGRRLGTTGGLNASWSPDGRYLLVRDGLFSLETADTWQLVVESAEPGDADIAPSVGEKQPGACWHDGSWSPDGSRLLLVEGVCDGDDRRLHIVRTSDWSEIGRLDGCCASWLGTRDGFAYLPAGKAGVLTIVTRDGTRPEPIRGATGAVSAAWSPTARRLAFVKGRPGYLELVTVRRGGAGARRIAAGSWTSASVGGWSSDGRRVILTFVRGSAATVATVRSTGGGTQVLLQDLEGAWDRVVGSSSGGRVVVERTVSGLYPDGLWSVRADGSGLRRVTTTGPGGVLDPAWSPDGSQIAFWRDIPRQARRPETLAVYTVASTGGTARHLVGGPRGAFASDPAWSPDGKRLAFVRWPDLDHQDIVVVGANGHGLRRLTSTGSGVAPAWSPDGALIAFSDNGRPTTVAATGGAPTVLGTDPLLQDCYGFDWSPDGRKLAATCDGRLLVLDRAGSVLRTLVTDARSGPSWSPDGNRIVYGSDGVLKVVGAEGSSPTVLDLHGASSTSPDWGP